MATSLLLMWRHRCAQREANTPARTTKRRRFLRSLFGVFIRLVYHKSLSTATPSGRARKIHTRLWDDFWDLDCVSFSRRARRLAAARAHTRALKNTTRTHVAERASATIYRGRECSVRCPPKPKHPHVITNIDTQETTELTTHTNKNKLLEEKSGKKTNFRIVAAI